MQFNILMTHESFVYSNSSSLLTSVQFSCQIKEVMVAQKKIPDGQKEEMSQV